MAITNLHNVDAIVRGVSGKRTDLLMIESAAATYNAVLVVSPTSSF